MDVVDLQAQLRDAGLRVTAPRVAVLRVLSTGHDHPRVDQVRDRVQASGVSISTQAVYDVCEALHGAGLARRLGVGGGPVRYEARIGDSHHHLVCRVCGTTVDVDRTRDAAPCLPPGQAHGFALDEAEVTYWGTCPTCQSTPKGELHV